MFNSEKPFYLVKIINKKWADKLMDGEVFMRTIACFGDVLKRSSDCKNQFRGDTLEGFSLAFEKNHNPYTYTIDKDGNIVEIVPSQIGLIDVLTYREKIFSMYALEFDKEKKQFIKPDSRLAEFGDTAIIIHNSQEFLHRICYTMLERFKEDFWVAFNRVNYDVDFTISKPYDEFSKCPSYSWQNEFRVVLDLALGKFNPDTLEDVTDFAKLTFPGKIIEDTNPDSLADSLTLNIGNIRDICISLPMSEFIKCDNIKNYLPNDCLAPCVVAPMIPPKPPMPTFFKVVSQLP